MTLPWHDGNLILCYNDMFAYRHNEISVKRQAGIMA